MKSIILIGLCVFVTLLGLFAAASAGLIYRNGWMVLGIAIVTFIINGGLLFWHERHLDRVLEEVDSFRHPETIGDVTFLPTAAAYPPETLAGRIHEPMGL